MTDRGQTRRVRPLIVAVSGALMLVGVVGGAAKARQVTPDVASAREAKLGTKVMCMCGTCNMPAATCNHPGSSFSGPCDVARAELTQVRDRISQGASDDLILQSFVQEYGPLVLIEPPRAGFDWTVWIVPVLAPLLALFLVWIVIRRWRARATPALAGGPNVSPELLARVRRDAADEGGDQS